MSCTYTGNPVTVLSDEVRMLIGDIGTPDPTLGGDNRLGCKFDDETILYYLARYPQSVYRACIRMIENAMISVSSGGSGSGALTMKKTGDLTEKYASAEEAYASLRAIKDSLMEQEIEQGGLDVWVGGVDRQEVSDEISNRDTIGSDIFATSGTPGYSKKGGSSVFPDENSEWLP